MSATACDRVQGALVERATLAGDLAGHLEGCAECRFVASLSRELEDALPITGGPLGPLSAVLASAAASGDPLLGRWALIERLGAGGQGEVYRARDVDTGELVAVKVVRDRAGATDEVVLARRIAHAGVCRVFHTERFGAVRLIVMELIAGPSLAAAAAGLGRRDRLAIFVGVCDAIAAAHRAGVVHLDLKPHNVLLRDGRVPVVTDFGLATTTATATGGTPGYMAPEQRDGGSVGPRTDVYALGQLLRELAPRGHARVIRRATDRDPSRRHPDAAALAVAVRGRGRARRVAIVLGALLAAVIALAIVAVVMRPRGPRATWHAELWGPDLVDAEAWNVARNTRAHAAPGFGCARSTADLVDGIAQYANWEHGFAFPAEEPVCISADALRGGGCGEPNPDAPTCPGGQLDGGVPCGERVVELELDRPYPVVAVRAWHHDPQQVPARYRILVEDGGGWRQVFQTLDNTWMRTRSAFALPRVPAPSAPLTAQFPTVTTRRVRLVLDSCSMSDLETGARGHGWLYEIEVFARVSLWEAWSRSIELGAAVFAKRTPPRPALAGRAHN